MGQVLTPKLKSQINQAQAQQFLNVVRDLLDKELEKISLTLMTLEMAEEEKSIFLAGVEGVVVIVGVVTNLTSRRTEVFQMRVGAQFGDTEPSDVEPLVWKLVKELKDVFYGV